MTNAWPLSPFAIDRAFAELCDRLPPDLRRAAVDLPSRLGISTPDNLWSAYATLPPVVDLPSFVGPAAAELDLALARKAHWYAGFVGLCLDRVADAQAPELSNALLSRLEREWVEALGALSRDPVAAEASVGLALDRARAAFVVERAARSVQSMDHPSYIQMTRDKTVWFGLASRELASRVGGPVTHEFDVLFETVMLALQTYDDAIDAEEDQAQQGVSVPTMIALSPPSMLVASAELMRRAAVIAERAQCQPLSLWLQARADHTNIVAKAGPLDVFGATAFLDTLSLIPTRPVGGAR